MPSHRSPLAACVGHILHHARSGGGTLIVLSVPCRYHVVAFIKCDIPYAGDNRHEILSDSGQGAESSRKTRHQSLNDFKLFHVNRLQRRNCMSPRRTQQCLKSHQPQEAPKGRDQATSTRECLKQCLFDTRDSTYRNLSGAPRVSAQQKQ